MLTRGEGEATKFKSNMKKGLILVLFALVSTVSFAQISWSGKVGMNMSNFTGDAETDMRVGFNLGVGMEYSFTDLWSLQTGLMFSQKGAKFDAGEGESVKYNPLYLEIPVMAGARFAVTDNQSVLVKAGPYFGIGIAGKVKSEYSEEGESFSEKGDFFGDGEDQFGGKRFDCGLGIGVAYEINKFFVSLDGQFGFTPVVDYDMEGVSNPKNMNFSIGVGYKF